MEEEVVRTPRTEGTLPERKLEHVEHLMVQNLELRFQLNAEKKARLLRELQDGEAEFNELNHEMSEFRAVIATKHGVDPQSIRIRRDGYIEVGPPPFAQKE